MLSQNMGLAWVDVYLCIQPFKGCLDYCKISIPLASPMADILCPFQDPVAIHLNNSGADVMFTIFTIAKAGKALI